MALGLASSLTATETAQHGNASLDASQPADLFAHLGTPTFEEDFSRFDAGPDQKKPQRPHRWRTVYGHGGAASPDNRAMSGTSFAADPSFPGVKNGVLLDRPLGLDPFEHQPGNLAILARKTPPRLRPLTWDKPFFGGAITTKFSFSQRYGYFEIEARLPKGKGMWPAFWLLPVTGKWPDAGEIDVMENLGDPKVIYCTVIAGAHKQTRKIALDFDASKDFHRYGLAWGPERLRWYVDRREVASAPTPPALRQRPAYMIANLAIGGKWGGYPDDSTAFPGRYEIKRVRAWRLPPVRQKN